MKQYEVLNQTYAIADCQSQGSCISWCDSILCMLCLWWQILFGHLIDGVFDIPTTDKLPEVILLSCHCHLTLITVETGMNWQSWGTVEFPYQILVAGLLVSVPMQMFPLCSGRFSWFLVCTWKQTWIESKGCQGYYQVMMLCQLAVVPLAILMLDKYLWHYEKH